MKHIAKISTLIIILIFFISRHSYSQDLENNQIEYKRLNDSIAKYIDTNTRLAIEFAKKQLTLAKINKDTVQIIQVLNLLGKNYQHIAEFKESRNNFERELQLLRKIDIRKKKYAEVLNSSYEIDVLIGIGRANHYLGDVKNSMKYFDEGIEIARDKKLERYHEYLIPSFIAELQFTTGNYKDALISFKNMFDDIPSMKSFTEIEKNRARKFLSYRLSNIYLELQMQDSALWVLERARKIDLDTTDVYTNLIFQAQLGKIFLEKKEYNKALHHLKAAEKYGYVYDSVLAPANVSLELAQCYLNLKDYDQAIKTLENGIRIKKLKTKEIYLTEDYKLLAEIYKEAGDLEKSNAYYEKYIINQTALEKSKDTITSSFHDKEIQDLAKEKSFQKNRLLYVISGISVLVLGLFFVILYLIKERKKNTKKFENLLAKMNVDSEAELQIVDTKDSDLDEKSSADVNEEITKQILNGLEKLKEQEYFLKQECNSYNVAKKIKTNTSYLSKVINSHFQKNFNTYINDLRINYAIVRLKNDSRFRSFSIQSIAEELGYKSADSFTKYFKQDTGLNPSFYIKQLNTLG